MVNLAITSCEHSVGVFHMCSPLWTVEGRVRRRVRVFQRPAEWLHGTQDRFGDSNYPDPLFMSVDRSADAFRASFHMWCAL